MTEKPKKPPKKPAPKSKDKAQSARFLETAKHLDADESGESFSQALDVLVPKKKGKEG